MRLSTQHNRMQLDIEPRISAATFPADGDSADSVIWAAAAVLEQAEKLGLSYSFTQDELPIDDEGPAPS
ncbi:MAG: hypothetical protein MO846_12295 [Candidatus Devosia symbiotica]|nr:hypothetical protein [Candidatus Devosia symbiotica]